MADSRGVTGAQSSPAAVVRRLVDAGSETERDAAWGQFVDRFSRLILHTVRRHAPGYDDTMDRYAFVLERLREDDYARLGRFTPHGAGRFSTWLVVVTRRLCDDFHRRKYGRLRAGAGEEGARARERHETRRRLLDMVAEDGALDSVPATAQRNPEAALRHSELKRALERAVSTLSDRDRLMLQLRFEEGMTAREVARLMRISSQYQVYRRVNTLLARLRKHLEAEGFSDSRP